jgi:hypothetical protein
MITKLELFIHPSIKKIVSTWVNSLENELNAYFSETKDKTLFEFNERALLGFFVNGLIRNDFNFNCIPIHELAVYEEDGRVKRTDLQICYKNSYYLIECKRNHISIDHRRLVNTEKTQDYLDKILQKANEYYDIEKEFYEQIMKRPTFIVALVFDRITFNYKEQLKSKIEKMKFIIPGYFHVIFQTKKTESEQCLSLFGLIKKVN